jgi:hypothetical protein
MPIPASSAEQPPHPAETTLHQEVPRSKSFLRVLLPVLFLLATVGIVFGLMSLLKIARGPVPARSDSSRSSPPVSAPATEAPPSPSLAVSEASETKIAELPPNLDPQQTSPAMLATETLEKFLAAKSLAERMNLIESRTPEAELAESVLARELPEVRGILIDLHESNPSEQLLDIFFNVDLASGGNQISPQTILVRTRGSESPKVVVDPFLDSFGGRLAAYVAKPSDKQGVFQVIVSALASCHDKEVPNRDKKLTLKLLSRDNTKEIARAYFGRQSKIGLMLEDGTFSLSYGKAKACTVILHWNTEENPQMPYLEVIGLKSLDWNL